MVDGVAMFAITIHCFQCQSKQVNGKFQFDILGVLAIFKIGLHSECCKLFTYLPGSGKLERFEKGLIKEMNLGWFILTNALYYFQSWLAHLPLQSFNHIDASSKDAASKSFLVHKFH